jgi:protein involved in polysaccharide export with SLBB domain
MKQLTTNKDGKSANMLFPHSQFPISYTLTSSMKTLQIKLLTLLTMFTVILTAQTEAQLTNEINKRGINTMSEVNAALAAQGMTEAEARKMAKVYGINYDDYIAKHILGGKSKPNKAPAVSSEPAVTETTTTISYSGDAAVAATPTVKAPKVDPKYFGYEIFQNNPFANKDYLVGNIDENYILGPGDEIRLYVWGSHAYQAQVRIDLNGNIVLPDNGVFFASGYTFKTLKKKLRNYLGKSYSGLITSPQTSFIDVSLTQLRPVSITVLGESNAPGPHLVNGFATVLNALYASGGVKTSGSLREIKVYRNNKLIKTVDLYDYITKGALTKDIRLMNNDVVFIPIRNNSITLNGAVKKSATFELKDSEGLNELLELAGGLNADASLKNVSLSRIKPFEERLEDEVYHRFITSIDLAELKAAKKNYELHDGDQISVKSILGKVLNQASITGPVKRPGTYAISEFPDIHSLIVSAADSLMPRVYMERVHLYRLNEDGTRNFFSFNLENILSGKENFALENEDRVELFSLEHTEGDDRTVSISGFGSKGGIHRWNEDMTMYDVIFYTVSLEDKDFQAKVLNSRVDLSRFNTETGLYYKKSYNLLDVLSKEENEKLLPRDKIVLYSKGLNTILDQKVAIKGYVKKPGSYTLTEDMTVEDLVLLAGGYLEYAVQEEAIVSRPKFDVDKGEISEEFDVNLDLNYILGTSKERAASAFYLEHRDVVNIRQIPGVEGMKSITVSGEVRYPGVVSLTNKNQNLKEVLAKAGGMTPFASLKSSYILRGGDRFIVDMKKTLRDEVSFLQDGDKIVIGTNTGAVSVKGAVPNEGLFVWEQGKRVKGYIRNSGNYEGAIENVIVQHPNGISKKKRWYTNPRVMPNSQIYVYAKPEKDKKESNGNGMDKFIEVLSVITGALTTIILTRTL